MSMAYCHSCGNYIDTDMDDTFYDDGKEMCETCRENQDLDKGE